MEIIKRPFEISQRILQAHCQSPTSQRYNQSFVKECNFADTHRTRNGGYMSILRVILAVIFPPLSVVGYGCGSILIVLILTFAGWIPGIIAALIIINKKK